MSESRPYTLAALTMSLMVTGCPQSPEDACDPSCSQGFVCDAKTQTCVSNSLERFEGAIIPGRAVRAASFNGQLLTASLLSQANAIILRFGQTPPRQLTRDVRAGSTRLGLDARADRAIVAWVGRSGAYQVAQSVGEELDSPWRVSTLLTGGANGEADYSASQDFDIALGEDGSKHLVFRDGQTRALMHLWQAPTAESWQKEVIDDGRSSLGVEVCTTTTRQRVGRGVGIEPDLLSSPRGLIVAYHDGDCGDLRIARRLGSSARWLISLVDQGAGLAQAPGQRSITGRWPSIAVTGQGAVGISYHDSTLGQLMYAYAPGETFTREVVDEGLGFDLFGKSPKKVVGAFSALSFDAQGGPLITYFDATQTAMMSAQRLRNTQQWSISSRLDEGLVGLWGTHMRGGDGSLWLVAERLRPSEGKMVSELVVEEVIP